MQHLPSSTLDDRGPGLGLAEFLAIARGLHDEIGTAEGDITHFRFEASMAEILGAEIDLVANATAIRDAERRLVRLRERHIEAVRQVEVALAKGAR